MGASSASAINMMDTMDDHVYCNSTTATVAATSPSTVTTTTSGTATATATVAPTTVASPRDVPKPASQESSASDDQFQQSSPSQYSPSPSSPLPASPQPASPRPSSPGAPSSSAASSPAPSSPVPSMEDETLMMEDDDETVPEPVPMYANDELSNEPGNGEAFENEAEAEFVNDVYDYGAQNGDDQRLINPEESDYEDEEIDEDEDDDDDLNNIASDSGVLTDDQQGDDPGEGENNGPSMAEALIAMNEVKQLQSILLLHLDLIQEQGDQILNKDKMINRLKDENEGLKLQLDLANRRVSLMMMHLQQNGLALPLDVQQQMLLQAPKQEGTVSPLTIRSHMENGRMRTVILKSSSSPPFVSSSVMDGGTVYGPCLPIRNPEVSSTVSPAKEELPDELVLQNDPIQSPFYNADDDDDNGGDGDDDDDDDDDENDNNDEEEEDEDEEEQEDFHTENNEVDGEIFLNYSKSDDEESLSQGIHPDFEEQKYQPHQLDEDNDAEDEQEDQDVYYQQEQQQQQQYMLLQQQQQQQQQQQLQAYQENIDGFPPDEMDEADDEEGEEEQGGYESNVMDEEEEEDEDVEETNSPVQYGSDDPANYDDAPIVMIDDGAVEVTMETDSPASQASSQDSQESQDSQDSQASQPYQQESQDSSSQHESGPGGNGLEVNVPFVESTVGSEGEQQPEDEDCKEVMPEMERTEMKTEEDTSQSTKQAAGEGEPREGTSTERMPFRCSEPTESGGGGGGGVAGGGAGGGGGGENGGERGRGGYPRLPRPFNPSLHCPSGNSSDGSVAGTKRSCKPTPAYMVTQKQYVSCNWKDDAVTAELEKLLSNEAAELEIPSWTVIDDDADDPVAGGCDPPGGGGEEESVSASEPSRENISDEAYSKRHMKLEIDERRRKKWDVQRIREQKNIERLKKRQLKEQPVEQEAQKTITTLYPTVDTLKYIQVTDDVPVQAFGELIPLLPTNGCFSLPWHQPKPGPSFANPQNSYSTASSAISSAALPGPSGGTTTGIGLLLETKTKFIHRLAPNLQAQKQRFTKRIKKDL